MSSKVEVLCPNGHRVNVKTTPNTKVLQILEEACMKQGFQPASDYELKHGRKTLDVTLSVRFAGIPNLAKLELVKSAKSREETVVLIALQLPTGERVQNEFQPGTTLWQVLQHWEGQQDGKYSDKLTTCSEEGHHPVCIYTREEVIGQYAMENTTLRSLGLTGGKAMLRLAHRNVQPDILDNIKAKIDQEKSRHQKITAKLASTEKETGRRTSVTKQNSSSISSAHDETKEKHSAISRQGNIVSSSSYPRAQSPMDVSEGASASNLTEKRTVDIPQKHGNNAASDSGSKQRKETGSQEEPMEVIYTSGARPKSQKENGGQASVSQPNIVHMPGVTMITPGGSEDGVLTPEQEALARSLAQAIRPEIMQQYRDPEELARRREQRIRNMPPVPQKNQFADFKFPESTKGKDLYRNELSQVDKEQFHACDRETVIYSVDEARLSDGAEAMQTQEDLPDEFFEVTESDVRVMWADTQRKMKEDEEQALMTKSMRLAAKENKMSRYERVIIRVVFTEKMVLQGLFRPRETVYALQKFVKEHLEDKTTDFYLYTTPPKHVLKDRSSTLIEADLAPMSVVYFGSEKKADSYLSKAMKPEMTTEMEAFNVLVKYMPKPRKSVAASTSAQPSSRSTQSSSTRSAASAGLSAGKVPKWFKIGKK